MRPENKKAADHFKSFFEITNCRSRIYKKVRSYFILV